MESEKDGNEEILIVEDSPTQASMLKFFLEKKNFRVCVACNGREALELLKNKQRPIIVISDIVMPEMDGYLLCRCIKENKELKDIPVILLTVLSDPVDVLKGLECGADNFIIKPYDEKYLFSRIQYVLANRILRESEKMQMGIEISFGGRKYHINAERQQILNLLLSTYETAVQKNAELQRIQGELEAINEQLDASNKELEAFGYSVSHDLMAPVRNITGFTRALIEDYADRLDEQGKDYLDRVRSAALRMEQLIDAMLTLSRLTRGELNRETVNLSAMAKTIADELRKTQPERVVDFVIAEGVTANGDARMLRIVLENLMGNAWKFTGSHQRAKIEFGVTEKEGKPAYFVRDDGAGFNMAFADKLFNAFSRLHPESQFPGIGIGLATVARIVHRHGGSIFAEGEVEKGATFYFTLGRGS